MYNGYVLTSLHSIGVADNVGCASLLRRMNPGRSGPARADVAEVQNGYIRWVRNNHWINSYHNFGLPTPNVFFCCAHVIYTQCLLCTTLIRLCLSIHILTVIIKQFTNTRPQLAQVLRSLFRLEQGTMLLNSVCMQWVENYCRKASCQEHVWDQHQQLFHGIKNLSGWAG